MPKGAGVLYLLKDRFQIYTSLTSTIFELRFSAKSVHNFRVLNQEMLAKEVDKLIVGSNIPPSNLIIVISDDASFITDIDQEKLSKQEEKFQEQAPAEQLIVRTMHPAGSVRLYATNRDLYQCIKIAFEKRGFTIEFVLPGFVFSNNLGPRSGLTPEMAAIVFKEAISLQRYDLLVDPKVFSEQETSLFRKQETFREQRKKDIMHLYAMANVFGVLVIAFLVIWNINNSTPSQTYEGKAGTDQAAVVPNIRETKDLTVRIISERRSSADARRLKKSLTKYNFKSLVLQRQKPSIDRKATIVFSNKTSPTVRNAVLTEVKKYASGVTFRDEQNSAFDITIILGR